LEHEEIKMKKILMFLNEEKIPEWMAIVFLTVAAISSLMMVLSPQEVAVHHPHKDVVLDWALALLLPVGASVAIGVIMTLVAIFDRRESEW